MARAKRKGPVAARARKLDEGMMILRALGFAPRQSHEVASYALLAVLDLKPTQSWSEP